MTYKPGEEYGRGDAQRAARRGDVRACQGRTRYERTAGRETYHSGQYARWLVTGAGEVDLSVPKLCGAAARTVRDGSPRC